MTPRLSTGQLEAFMLTFECGTLSGAAEALHLAQSTVSRQIDQLETELGCRLFTRSPTGVQPTESGEILYAHAKRVAGDLTEAAHRIACRRTEPTLRAASVAGALYTVLPDAVAILGRRHPEVHLQVTEATTDEICDGVRDRQIDVGLVTLPVGDGFLVDVLSEDELVLAVPPRHALAQKRRVRLSEVRDEAFVLLTSDQMLHRSVVGMCQSQGFAPRVAFLARSVHLCCHLVARGQGVSVVPRSSINYRIVPAPRYLSLVPVQRRTLAAIRLAPTEASGLFVECLQSLFRPARP